MVYTVIIKIMRFLYDEVGLLKVFHKSYKDKFHMAQQCSTKLTKIPLYITSILSFTDKQCCHSGNAEDIKVCFWCSQVCLFYPQLVIEDKREVLKFLSDFIACAGFWVDIVFNSLG